MIIKYQKKECCQGSRPLFKQDLGLAKAIAWLENTITEDDNNTSVSRDYTLPSLLTARDVDYSDLELINDYHLRPVSADYTGSVVDIFVHGNRCLYRNDLSDEQYLDLLIEVASQGDWHYWRE